MRNVVHTNTTRKLGQLSLLSAMLSLGLVSNSHADGTVECNVNAGFPNSTTECGINAIASGEFSTAMGSNTNATGLRSASYGRISDALADDATALGHNADALAIASVAVGQAAIVTVGATNGTAVGRNALVTDAGGLSLGGESDAQGIGATAVGSDGADPSVVGAQAIGPGATAIGSDTVATGTNATAIGNGATAMQDNSLVLGSIPNINQATSYVNVGIGTNVPAAPLHIERTTEAATELFRFTNTGGSFITWVKTNTLAEWNMNHANGSGNMILNHSFNSVADGPEFALDPNGNLTIQGTLTEMSDFNAKQDFVEFAGALVLAKLAQLPVSEWAYKSSPGSRHVGPMAQDFHKTFGLGTSETTISPRDMAGVSLAAVKALKDEKDAEKAEKDAEIAALRDELAALKALIQMQVATQ